MLFATGLTPETMKSPQVGICSVWFEGNPCNMHLLDLSALVKEGTKAAGLNGFRFNTIGVSDGISMGTDGMSYSLQSRDIIADSIETTMGGQVPKIQYTGGPSFFLSFLPSYSILNFIPLSSVSFSSSFFPLLSLFFLNIFLICFRVSIAFLLSF